MNRIQNNMFSFEEYVNTEDENTVRVLHVAFKGLRKIGCTKVHKDNKAIRGMVNSVRHLVTVTEN